MGALSLTGQPSKREPFLPLLKNVKHVPYGDIEAMRRSITKKTAMVIIEPIMGEAGVIVPPTDYLQGLRQLCDKNGALLVIDAVQTGMGRTGDWFGYEYSGITPDVITLAKGLGGGLPLGAMIAIGDSADLFKPGEHGSTFGGNPVAAAAAIATLEVIRDENLMQNAIDRGAQALKGLRAGLAGNKHVTDIRGIGLMIGVDFTNGDIAGEVEVEAFERGLLVLTCGDRGVRMSPPLVVNEAEMDTAIRIFSEAAAAVAARH
jgi:acetylornithine aminotransferase